MAETGTEIVASNSQQGLTAQQEAFVAALMRGAEPADAAVEAGRPGDETALLLESVVQHAIEARSRALLISSIPTALVEIKHLSRTAAPAHRARIEACRALLAMAGFVPPMRERSKVKNANLAEMDADTLRGLVDQIQGELGARATPVSAPIKRASSLKATDIFD